MSTALKDRYNSEFFNVFTEALQSVISPFNKEEFLNEFNTVEFEQLELKQRMSFIADVLTGYVSKDFKTACNQLIKCVDQLKQLGIKENFEYMFLPEYVATNGMNDFDTSVNTLAATTHFTSSEFAVRPFILVYKDRMLDVMLSWTKNSDPKIRRLASEGCRPRLPWAMALPELKQNPTPILGILEDLKNDSDELVRRSVANNLNDISKDNPAVTLSIARKWLGKHKETDALVKHACRGLLKAGNTEALELFNIRSTCFHMKRFVVHTMSVRMGTSLSFEFDVFNQSEDDEILRLEYVIYLLKKNGQHSKKVFKISERTISAKASISITKKHLFKPITTRVYYAGVHYFAPIINGKEINKVPFTLCLD